MAKSKMAVVGPIGYHYHPCYECDKVFMAETTGDPWGDDEPYVPMWCGCDGSVGVEDKLCEDCATNAYDGAYDDDDRDRCDFADPYGISALRAETGGSTGHCPKCKGKIGPTDNFCKHCAAELNPRKHPCPDCGAKNVLTTADVQLHYCCDRCAARNEGVYIGGDY